MRRVAIFASAFHPSLGGVEELVRQQVRHFRAEEVEALVVTNRWPRDLPEREYVEEVPVRRLAFRFPGFGWRSEVSFAIAARKTLRELEQELRDWGTELIHVQCVSTNGWYALKMSRTLRVPLLVTSQGERTMDAAGLYQNRPLMNRLLRELLRHADGVSACSKATLEDLRAYAGGGLAGGTVIYNGVGKELFETVRPWAHSRPYLLAMGRMVPQKGFRELVEGFAREGLEGVDLVLAGEGPEEGALRNLVRERRLEERVVWAGRADRAQVASLVSGCRGLVVPSLREPMGIVALEGLAQGRPLAVSRVGGLPEVVPEGEGARFFQPGELSEVGRALRWLAQESPRFVASNRKWAERFRWEIVCGQYADLYRELWRKKGHRPEVPAFRGGALSCGGQTFLGGEG
jgi:glycogen(starch) synthase